MGNHAAGTLDVSAYIDESIVDTSPAIFTSSARFYSDQINAEQISLPITASRRIRAHKLMKLHYPRGMPWHDYPVVCDPQFRPDLEASDTEHDEMVSSVEGIVGTVGAMGRIIYDDHGHEKDLELGRYLTGIMAERLFPGVPILARFDEETEFSERSAHDLMARDRCRQRLRYSYAVNFRAIGFKAIRHIFDPSAPGRMWAAQKEKSSGRRAEKSKRALQVAAAWEARGISGFDRMEYLQFLFALRHIDPCQLFFSFSTLFVAPEAPGRIEGHRWLGSGKYPSVNVAFAFDQFLVEALALGFVEVDCDKGGIGLSDNGQRLLDAVHPDNEDIDAICRWADPIMIERMEAVDAWVLRFFRKMKTRVNLMD